MSTPDLKALAAERQALIDGPLRERIADVAAAEKNPEDRSTLTEAYRRHAATVDQVERLTAILRSHHLDPDAVEVTLGHRSPESGYYIDAAERPGASVPAPTRVLIAYRCTPEPSVMGVYADTPSGRAMAQHAVDEFNTERFALVGVRTPGWKPETHGGYIEDEYVLDEGIDCREHGEECVSEMHDPECADTAPYCAKCDRRHWEDESHDWA